MKKTMLVGYLFAVIMSVTAQDVPLQLSLEEAIDYAIKNNYDNKVALKDIEAAKKQKWETTTIGLPQINGKIDYQYFLEQQVSVIPGELTGGEPGTFVPVVFGTEQTANASLTLNQLIFDFSYLVGLQSARTFLKISEQAKEKTELTTREAVINAYGNVLVAEKTIDILKGNQRILKKNLNETQKIYDNGLTEEENVEQLQITLGTLENNLRNAERLKEIAYQLLNISLGNKIKKKLELSDTLESLTVLNTDLELLTKTFDIDEHIDYRIAENDREAKRLLVSLEKSKGYPSISAFLNYGGITNTNSFPTLDSNEWFDYSLLGVSLNVPIFSSFGRSAKTKRAKIELEIADIRLREIEQRLNLQAQTAKSEYQLSIENYETAKKNLALAERIEKKQQVKFFEGISSSFDLSQAQNQLYTQQTNYVQSMLNVVAKKAQLENALNIPVKY